MTIFYIDTTSSYLYTGIIQNNHLLNFRKEALNHDLSVLALHEVDKMFQEVSLKPDDVDKIIVVNGPGSFTGIRIGVTIAKIFAWSLKKEIITISSLEAMASSIKTDKLIVPIINARRNCVYGAIYQNDEVIFKEQYLSISELAEQLKLLDKPYIFIANDSFNNLPIQKYDPDILNIVLKYQNRSPVNPHLVNPSYLKLTEAEETKLNGE